MCVCMCLCVCVPVCVCVSPPRSHQSSLHTASSQYVRSPAQCRTTAAITTHTTHTHTGDAHCTRDCALPGMHTHIHAHTHTEGAQTHTHAHTHTYTHTCDKGRTQSHLPQASYVSLSAQLLESVSARVRVCVCVSQASPQSQLQAALEALRPLLSECGLSLPPASHTHLFYQPSLAVSHALDRGTLTHTDSRM